MTPPPVFSPAELDTLVNDHGYSPDDAVRALTICHEIRLLQAAGVGGVAAAQELTRRVLDRREVVGGGGGGSAGGASMGAGGGSVGGGGSGGVAEICGGVSGGAGAEVDTGCKSGGGDAMPVKKFKSESLGGSGRRHLTNKIWRSGRYLGEDETSSAPKPLKSPSNGWDVHRASKAGAGGMCGSGGGGGGESAAGGGGAPTGWPPRIAGRKRQHSAFVHGSGGGGAFNGQINRGGTNGYAGASEHGGIGDQGMFPAPSPSRPRAQGLLSRENGNISVREATRVGDAVERWRGRIVSATGASSAPLATHSTVSANRPALLAPNAMSSPHSAHSESGNQGADNEGGTGRYEASHGPSGSDHPQWNSVRSERVGNGRSGDSSDMMDVTSPTIMPAAKRPLNHNGYNTTTTTIGSDGVGGLFQRDYHHIQQQRQQQQLMPGGVVGRGGGGVGDGIRESHPLVFEDQQRVPHQDEQQLQHAFHRLGVRHVCLCVRVDGSRVALVEEGDVPIILSEKKQKGQSTMEGSGSSFSTSS